MMRLRYVFVLSCLLETIYGWSPGETQPNIVFVLADDLGKINFVRAKLAISY